jgi:hypothetical protein
LKKEDGGGELKHVTTFGMVWRPGKGDGQGDEGEQITRFGTGLDG